MEGPPTTNSFESPHSELLKRVIENNGAEKIFDDTAEGQEKRQAHIDELIEAGIPSNWIEADNRSVQVQLEHGRKNALRVKLGESAGIYAENPEQSQAVQALAELGLLVNRDFSIEKGDGQTTTDGLWEIRPIGK